MIKSFFARNIFQPLHIKFYRKDKSLEYFKDYRKNQWNSLEVNEQNQKEMLYSLLKYSIEKIPYYKKLAEEKNIVISKEKILNDLKKFPIMTKAVLKNEFDDLNNLDNKTSWFYDYSGGSTGEPTKVILDKKYNEHSSAVNMLHFEWAGCNYGDPVVQLWGSRRDILQEKEKLSQKVSEWIRSVYILNSFSMNNELMKDYIGFINKKKPKMILAYVNSIDELSKFILKNNIKVHSPFSIMTSAGILYPEFRRNIERAFRCSVFNRYGSREAGSMASQCERHEGLHVSIFTHYLEILNDKLEDCKEGEMGNIYVTSLVNYSMPLIRYKIGDMALYTEKKCSCGRGLPIIKSIIGRDMDVFKTRDGKIIDGNFYVHFVGVAHNNGSIEKFQVIQKDYDLIQIKAVINDADLFETAKKDIEDSFKKIMGNDCEIIWEEVEDIPPLNSGKYRYTIREFD